MSERWRSGVAFLACLVVLAGVLLLGPSGGPDALRRALGFGGPGTPKDVPPGGVYAFLQHQPGDQDRPVAWDPCRPIRYEVNPVDGPDDAVAMVQEAVDEVAEVTGLDFDYQGETDRRPQWSSDGPTLARYVPVLVAWATEDEVDQLDGDVAGIGGASSVSAGPGGLRRYVTGEVTLDADAYDELGELSNGRDHQRAILLHELGHLVGLDHVDSPAELMYADNVGMLEFGRGDLNGLVALGRGRCF